MAEILGVQTVNGTRILSTDVNPALGLGTTAPIGSLCIPVDGSGTFIKTGATDIDWQQTPKLSSSSTGDSNTVVNTVTETNITTNNYTLSVPANTLKVGQVIRFTAFARESNSAVSTTLTIRLKNGATTLVTNTFTTIISQTNLGIYITGFIRIVSIGAGGTLSAQVSEMAISGVNTRGQVSPNITNKSINTTVLNTFQFSAQWGIANAVNTITFEQITWEVLN